MGPDKYPVIQKKKKKKDALGIRQKSEIVRPSLHQDDLPICYMSARKKQKQNTKPIRKNLASSKASILFIQNVQH